MSCHPPAPFLPCTAHGSRSHRNHGDPGHAHSSSQAPCGVNAISPFYGGGCRVQRQVGLPRSGAFVAELSLNSCWPSSPACTLNSHTGARPSDHPVVTRSFQLWTPALESSPNAGAAWTPTQPGQPLHPPVVTSEDKPAGWTWLSNRAWRAPSSPTECPCRTGSRDKDDERDLPLEKLGVYT